MVGFHPRLPALLRIGLLANARRPIAHVEQTVINADSETAELANIGMVEATRRTIGVSL